MFDSLHLSSTSHDFSAKESLLRVVNLLTNGHTSILHLRLYHLKNTVPFSSYSLHFLVFDRELDGSEEECSAHGFKVSGSRLAHGSFSAGGNALLSS